MLQHGSDIREDNIELTIDRRDVHQSILKVGSDLWNVLSFDRFRIILMV